MTQVPKVPRIWDLLESFKESCHRKGWKTSDYEDIVKIVDEYHNLIGRGQFIPPPLKESFPAKNALFLKENLIV